MDYRKIGDFYYLRMDRDDEIISKILEICKKEKISSAIFSGIGGCKEAEIQTYIPEEGKFEMEKISGMLELASMNGNGTITTGAPAAQPVYGVTLDSFWIFSLSVTT